MEYPQQHYSYQEPRTFHPTMFPSSGYTHSPAGSVVAFDYMHPSGFQDHSQQHPPYSYHSPHQPHHQNVYPSPYAPRRGSHAGPGSIGPVSPSRSATPNTGWTPSSSVSRQVGSASTSRWADPHSSYSGLSRIGSTAMIRPPQMNAAAPAFTPHFSSPQGSVSQNNQIYSPIYSQNGSTSTTERQSAAPRLHRTAPSISLSTLNRPAPPSARSPLATRGVSPVGSTFSTGTDGLPLLNSFGLPVNKPRTYKVLLPMESEELKPEETRTRSLWKRRPVTDSLEAAVDEKNEEMQADFRSKSPHPAEVYGPEQLPENLEVSRLPSSGLPTRILIA